MLFFLWSNCLEQHKNRAYNFFWATLQLLHLPKHTHITHATHDTDNALGSLTLGNLGLGTGASELSVLVLAWANMTLAACWSCRGHTERTRDPATNGNQCQSLRLYTKPRDFKLLQAILYLLDNPNGNMKQSCAATRIQVKASLKE